jgi:hypothetical protein
MKGQRGDELFLFYAASRLRRQILGWMQVRPQTVIWLTFAGIYHQMSYVSDY